MEYIEILGIVKVVAVYRNDFLFQICLDESFSTMREYILRIEKEVEDQRIQWRKSIGNITRNGRISTKEARYRLINHNNYIEPSIFNLLYFPKNKEEILGTELAKALLPDFFKRVLSRQNKYNIWVGLNGNNILFRIVDANITNVLFDTAIKDFFINFQEWLKEDNQC